MDDSDISFVRGGRWARVSALLGTLVFAGIAVAVFIGVKVGSVPGPGMLPGFTPGSRIVVSPVPYMVGEPRPGDVVLYDRPDGQVALHRVVAVAGQRARIEDGRLLIDGQPLEDGTPTAADCPRHASEGPESCACLVAEERAGDQRWSVRRWAPDAKGDACLSPPDWPPAVDTSGWRSCCTKADNPAWPDVLVPEGHVLLLGDSRDQARDGRQLGPMPTRVIRGRVVWGD